MSPGEIRNVRMTRKAARERFLAGRKGERFYAGHLNQVAKQIDGIVRGMAPGGFITDLDRLLDSLNRYAEILAPWAEAVAKRMVGDVGQRDASAWEKHGREIGQSLRREIM